MEELHVTDAGDLSAQFEAQERRRAERLSQAWQELVAQPAPALEAVIDYLGWVGGHERLSPILTLWRAGRLSPTTLNRVLAQWWNSAGYPSEVSASTIVRLFKDAGFVSDRTDVARPEALLVVYRGAGMGESRGVCWTTDPTIARFFAYRFGPHGRAVFSATVPPHGVLGLFFGRDESEVLVNPRTLREIDTQREAA